MRPSPLRNRVDPFGAIHAVAARGTLMGNRGGRIHDPASFEIRRRQASRAWIACVLAFRDRRRTVMGPGYTELFFLDEATALAAGHRPCFECRRRDALAFAAAWAEGRGLAAPPRAPEIDRVLAAERTAPPPRVALRDLPAGAVCAVEGRAMLRGADHLRPWSWGGWGTPVPLPRGTAEAAALTRPAILSVLRAGWQPRLHPSAGG